MFRSLVLAVLATFVASAHQPTVRDHRNLPREAAQWKSDGIVDDLSFRRLLNTKRGQHLSSERSGSVTWANVAPGRGKTKFVNCTRPGEVIHSSDLVSVQFGSESLIYSPGDVRLRAGQPSCEFRLIPSGAGLVPAGSGDSAFGIYSVQTNRYLVFEGGGLRWVAPPSGRAPEDVRAYADFIAAELVFTEGTWNGTRTQSVYLTIKNIGTVASSKSQRELKVRVAGAPLDFLIVNAVAPGAVLRNPIRLPKLLKHCEIVSVELDVDRDLKFQIGQAAFPTATVFANDTARLYARQLNRQETPSVRDAGCGPDRIIR